MKSDAELSKELYNKQFEDFSHKQTNYAPLQDLRETINKKYLSDIKSKKILFAGCGDGRECIFAKDNGAHVVGIDISDSAIKHAKKNCPGAEFMVMDIEQISFQNSTFDTIISFFVVMYKEDLQSVLRELRRVLKDDGSLIIAVPHPVRKMMKYNDFNYFLKGKKFETWKGIQRFNYLRLFEDYIADFLAARLKLVELMEPKPIKENLDTPDSEIQYPHFLVFRLVKDQ